MSVSDRPERWLTSQAQLVPRFMDYAPRSRHDDAALRRTIGQWLNNPEWARSSPYRFLDIGYDGTGGLFLMCWPAEADPSDAWVVYLGSEGGHGVLAASVGAWLEIVAHAPAVHEHRSPIAAQLPAAVFASTSPPRTGSMERAALNAYQGSLRARLGRAVAELDELTEGLEALNAAFCGWIAGARRTFSMDDMMRHGLSGAAGAGPRRRALAERLGVEPGNAKRVVARLNEADITRSDFLAAVRELP